MGKLRIDMQLVGCLILSFRQSESLIVREGKEHLPGHTSLNLHNKPMVSKGNSPNKFFEKLFFSHV